MLFFANSQLDRKDSFLRKTDFIEMVCFLYWCFEKTKLEIQFYTELSDLQNQVIKIPIEIKHKNMYLFFTGESCQYDYLVMFHHSKSDSKNTVFIEK